MIHIRGIMTKPTKIAVIGAGSSYTPELIEGIIAYRGSLPVDRIALMDINREKLNVIGALTERMLKKAGHQAKTSFHTDADEAISGAGFVLAQIRVGGLAARVLDETIPLKYDLLGQETTGAGGFANALRTVPVMLDIAHRMERLAPEAWLVNFSNPSGIVAEAVLNRTNIKMAGLCNNPVNMAADITRTTGRADFSYTYIGLNHLSWITSVAIDGTELLPGLACRINSNMQNIPKLGIDNELIRTVPYIPCGYLRYFYLRDRMVEACKQAKRSRGEDIIELEKSLFEKYRDTRLCEKPPELAKRGGALYSTAAISLVDAIANGRRETHVVNIKNKGAIPFMDNNDVVEVKALTGREVLEPVSVGGFHDDYIIGLMKAVKAYEKLTVEAALTGSRQIALAALMAHPLVGDYDKALGVLRDLLNAHAAHLPLFNS
jgi:6-phospho-beta-glucosidase